MMIRRSSTLDLSMGGLLVLCEVALGETNDLIHADSDAGSKLRACGKDSIKGLGRTVPSGSEPLPDGTCEVPMGPCTTVPRSDLSLQYNEYVVYNLDQVSLRGLPLSREQTKRQVGTVQGLRMQWQGRSDEWTFHASQACAPAAARIRCIMISSQGRRLHELSLRRNPHRFFRGSRGADAEVFYVGC